MLGKQTQQEETWEEWWEAALHRQLWRVLLQWPLAQSAGRGEGGGGVPYCLFKGPAWLEWWVRASGGLSRSPQLQESVTPAVAWCDPRVDVTWPWWLDILHKPQRFFTNSFCQRKKTHLPKRAGVAIFWDNHKEQQQQWQQKTLGFLWCLLCSRRRGNHCKRDSRMQAEVWPTDGGFNILSSETRSECCGPLVLAGSTWDDPACLDLWMI